MLESNWRESLAQREFVRSGSSVPRQAAFFFCLLLTKDKEKAGDGETVYNCYNISDNRNVWMFHP